MLRGCWPLLENLHWYEVNCVVEKTIFVVRQNKAQLVSYLVKRPKSPWASVSLKWE